jgi:hypothetical protein
MAIKKKQEAPPAKPVVSKIPMPPSDSALVIDLPDGQKLVIGKMEHGTVIEVATWRGTGRPDSRTNRMMLGMTNAELEASIEAAAEAQPAGKNQELKSKIGSIKQNPKQFVMNILRAVVLGIKWLFNFKDQFGSGNSNSGKQSKVKSENISTDSPGVSTTEALPETEKSASKFDFKSKFKSREKSTIQKESFPTVTSGDDDLEDWLNEIMAKTQKKVDKTSGKAAKSKSAAKVSARKPNTSTKKSPKRR